MKMAEVLAYALMYSDHPATDPLLRREALEEYQEMLREERER